MGEGGLLKVGIALLVLQIAGAGCRSGADAPRDAPGTSAQAPAAGGAGDARASAASEARSASQKTPKPGGTLTFALDKDMTLMNPMLATSSVDKWVRQLMFESLLEVDQAGNIQPFLAESWQTSGDGKTYTFHLRRGVQFHNGQEMTADDVQFSMDYTLNPRNGASGRGRLRLVQRTEIVDPYTLVVHLSSATPVFLAGLTSIQSFSVIPRGSLQDGIEQPTAFPPGTGPFKFVEWQPQQRLVMDRFDQYWGHKAYLDRLVFKSIADGAVRFTAVRAGDIDLAMRVPEQWVRQLANGEIRGLGYVEVAHSGIYRIELNAAGPPFNNVKLRQAVAHAIDRRELFDAAFFGFGEPHNQKYPRGHRWYFEGIPALPYDLNKAAALLREAGYNGEPIELTESQSSINQTLATTLQAQLSRIGMNVKIVVHEYGTYTDRMRRGDFHFRLGAAGKYVDAAETYGRDFMCEADLANRVNNITGYCDPEMDALFKAAETELDEGKRRELFHRILTKANEEVPTIYLGLTPRFVAFRDYVKDFTSVDDGTFRHYGGGMNYTWLDNCLSQK
jgi:peptide/nickel transport system substrate-binding protein